MTPNPSALALAIRIGPYELVEQLGEGGMGLVFLASQREPIRRDVALKVIKLGLDTEQVVARFELERQTLAQTSTRWVGVLLSELLVGVLPFDPKLLRSTSQA